MTKNLKILYIGLYQPTAPRDKIYLDGLKERGVAVSVLVVNDRGLKKFWRLNKEGRSAAKQSDLVWVGYASGLLVPLARLLSGKKVVWNALNSMYETYVEDRQRYRAFSPMAVALWFADFLAFHCASLSLVESESQKKYIQRRYFVAAKKIAVIYTGTDSKVFYPDSAVVKKPIFTAVFRGMFLPATGIKTVIKAAALMKNEAVDFVISGWGDEEVWVKSEIARLSLSRVRLNTVFMEPDALRRMILSSHVMLGQFSLNPRLDRTIQHKTFEALALGMPYVTRDSISNREILSDGENCIFISPNNPGELAETIKRLKNDALLCEKLSKGARLLYEQRCSVDALSKEVFLNLERLLG